MQDLLGTGMLTFSQAAGEITLSRLHRDTTLLVCAGSGFGQAGALIDSALHARSRKSLELLRCVPTKQAVYAANREAAWGTRVTKHLCVDPDRGNDNAGMRWLRRHGGRFLDADIVIAGSPAFASAAASALEGAGVARHQLFSDVLPGPTT